MASPMRDRMPDYINNLQETIVSKLETYSSGEKFRREPWIHDGGGGGLSCTFASFIAHHPIEKAAVNVSVIHGILPAAAVKQMSTAHAALENVDTSLPFFAAGFSLIIHPRHPRVPAVHTNYRYFQVLDAPLGDVLAWWFGTTTDMTPAYVNEPDFRHFHAALKSTCDAWTDAPHTAISIYQPLKKSCDDYLFIPHRHEHRGIGGIRFDDLDADSMRTLLSAQPGVSEALIARLSTEESLFGLVRSLGDGFLPCFIDILERRMDEPFVPSEKRWQLLRRGRSVEFTLVIERGTKFGLAAPGVKAENVLVSMPPEARWEYCSELEPKEAEMTKILKEPRNWVDS